MLDNVCPQIQIEPIPGYRLLERLGEGGFGEVWKAEAPGGILKAIKFVHGDLENLADEGRVHQELTALQRVKAVRHPFILSIERYDIVEGRLLIVTELADGSVWDRFLECQAQGLPGIPRNELLNYMEETAEALDLMNLRHQLQHLDIKPQNLFLVHNHVKVGDFGLVAALEGMRHRGPGWASAAYAAPETFEGQLSNSCDQYSLAIVYQELLCGSRPFAGANVRQLMMQHLRGEPNLELLPESERPVIARALSKKPSQRFASCQEFVVALREAGASTASLDLSEKGRDSGLRSRRSANLSSTRVNRVRTELVQAVSTEGDGTGQGVLRPAFLVGSGGLGLAVLRRFRGLLAEEDLSPADLPHLRWLAIDTDPQALQAVQEGETHQALTISEVLLARLQRPANYLRPSKGRDPVGAWMNISLLRCLPRDQTTTAGLRPLGRLALIDNFLNLVPRLREGLINCLNHNHLRSAAKRTGRRIRTQAPRIYVIAGLGGGTGSGMFLDLAYTLRQQLRELKCEQPELIGVLLLPPCEQGAEAEPLAATNTFAALTELNHFSAPDTTFTACHDATTGNLSDVSPPFDRVILLPMSANGGKDTVEMVAAQLYRELLTQLGPIIDAERPAVASSAPVAYHTFVANSLGVSKTPVLKELCRRLCRMLAQHWRTNKAELAAEVLPGWVALNGSSQQLEPEQITARLQLAWEQALGYHPLSTLNGQVESLAGSTPDPLSGREMLSQLDAALGLPGKSPYDLHPGLLVESLDQVTRTLLSQFTQVLNKLAGASLKEPRFRLTGLDEEIQHYLHAQLEELLEREDAIYCQLHTEVVALRQRMLGLIGQLSRGAWLRFGMQHRAKELVGLMRSYPEAFCRFLLARQRSVIYRFLLNELPRQLCQVACCRSWLDRFVSQLTEETVEPTAPLSPEAAAATEGILAGFSLQDLKDLSDNVFHKLRGVFPDNGHVCLEPDKVFQDLGRRIRETVRAQVASRVEAIIPQFVQDTASTLPHNEHDLLCNDCPCDTQLKLLALPPGGQWDKLAGAAAKDTVLREVPELSNPVLYREGTLFLNDLPHTGPEAEMLYRRLATSERHSPHIRCDICDWRPLVSVD